MNQSIKKENPLLVVIGETRPEKLANIIDRSINALVESHAEFAQDSFQDDYYFMCRLRDAVRKMGK